MSVFSRQAKQLVAEQDVNVCARGLGLQRLESALWLFGNLWSFRLWERWFEMRPSDSLCTAL